MRHPLLNIANILRQVAIRNDDLLNFNISKLFSEACVLKFLITKLWGKKMGKHVFKYYLRASGCNNLNRVILFSKWSFCHLKNKSGKLDNYQKPTN